MVTLDGLGYKFAGWEAAGGIREASGCLGAREAAYGPHPNPAPRLFEGNASVQGGSKLANLEHSGCQNTSYKTLSCKLTGSERLQGCKLTVEVITGLLD